MAVQASHLTLSKSTPIPWPVEQRLCLESGDHRPTCPLTPPPPAAVWGVLPGPPWLKCTQQGLGEQGGAGSSARAPPTTSSPKRGRGPSTHACARSREGGAAVTGTLLRRYWVSPGSREQLPGQPVGPLARIPQSSPMLWALGGRGRKQMPRLQAPGHHMEGSCGAARSPPLDSEVARGRRGRETGGCGAQALRTRSWGQGTAEASGA